MTRISEFTDDEIFALFHEEVETVERLHIRSNPKFYDIGMSIGEPPTPEFIEGFTKRFPDSDFEVIEERRYVGSTESIRTRDMTVTERPDQDSRVSVTKLDLPSEIEIRSFILSYRHFVSEESPIFFPSVVGRALKLSQSTDYSLLIRSLNKLYKKWRYPVGIRVRAPGINMSTSEAYDMFINGRFFHLDKAKSPKILTNIGHVYDLFYFEFVSSVVASFGIISLTDNVIRNCSNSEWIEEVLNNLKEKCPDLFENDAA